MDKRAFVDYQILDEISSKVEKLRQKNYGAISLTFQRYIEHCVEKEATLHSFRIEHDAEFFRTDYDTHASRKSIKKGSKSIMEAMKWGTANFDISKFDEKFVQELAAKTAQDTFPNGFGYYRNGSVRVAGANWTPPYREKIPREMERFVEFIKGNLYAEGIKSVIETSAFAHLHLIRIHPFDDGNGRTSRALQNVILQAHGLPPPVIYAGERHDYYEHLQNAINGWRNRTSDSSEGIRNSPDENSFYNYIAGKVSASLDRIISR